MDTKTDASTVANTASNIKNDLALRVALMKSPVVDINQIRHLILVGADVSQPDRDGFTPLHYACYSGDFLAVDLLLQHGANVAAKADGGHRPLHMACSAKPPCRALTALPDEAKVRKLRCIELLAERRDKGLDFNIRDKLQTTPFFCACYSNFPEAAQYLVESCDVKLDRADLARLHACAFWAASHSHPKLLRFLLKWIDQKQVFRDGRDLLSTAAGALGDDDNGDEDGPSEYEESDEYSKSRARSECVKALLASGSHTPAGLGQALCCAAEVGCHWSVQALIAAGAPLDAPHERTHITPAFMAVMNGNLLITSLLIHHAKGKISVKTIPPLHLILQLAPNYCRHPAIHNITACYNMLSSWENLGVIKK